MQNTYTLWQRIKSDTPLFFKKAQLFGLALAGIGTTLTRGQVVPSKFTAILIAVGSTITILSQFAVKQTEPITPTPDTNAVK